MQKHILLIGGSSGIGLSLCNLLIEKGYQVTVLSRKKNETPDEATFLSTDVCDLNTSLPTIDTDITGIVYLPGTINLKPFSSLTLDDFKQDFEVNYFGAVRCIQHYLPLMTSSKSGSITLISSVAATTGMNYHTSIGSAKAAVEGLCLSLAAELAPNIRVNAVAPSLTKTPLSETLLNTEKKLEASALRHPMKTVGEPEDIAHAIRYLISDNARWITGQIIPIDGGFSSLKII